MADTIYGPAEAIYLSYVPVNHVLINKSYESYTKALLTDKSIPANNILFQYLKFPDNNSFIHTHFEIVYPACQHGNVQYILIPTG